MIEGMIAKFKSNLSENVGVGEATIILIRAQFLIEQAAHRRSFINHIDGVIASTFSQDDLAWFMRQSPTFTKHYLAVLAFNFQSINTEFHFEIDISQIRQRVSKTQELDHKYLVSQGIKTSITVKLQIMSLDFYPLMTKEQFQGIKSQALSKNMKNRFTPQILAHCSIYNLRRSNLADSLNQINRAINIQKEIQPELPHSEKFIDLYIKKAYILAKLRKYEEAQQSIDAAQELRQKIFGLKREEDPG